VADGESQGVCSVFGGKVWQTQLHGERLLHLGFARRAVTDDGELGLFGVVVLDGDVLASSGEEHHASGHAELDGALGVFEDKLGLDGNTFGIEAGDQRFDRIKQNAVALLQRQVRGRADAAEVEGLDVRALDLDEAVAGDPGAGIDAENDGHTPNVSEKALFFYTGYMNVIVRMPNWIGDLVMATPVLADLRAHFPDASITAMCRRPLCELIAQDPNIDELFCFAKPPGGFARREERRGIVEKLRTGKYDVGVLLTNSFSSAWLMWQGRVKRRVGTAGHWRKWLLSDVVPNAGAEHEVISYKRILQPLGIPISNTKPKLYVSDDEVSASKELLVQRGYKLGKPLIGINPGASYGSAKCWPVERFRALALELLKHDVYLVFFGDNSTASLVKEICLGLPDRAMNLAGITSLRELMCIVRDCHVLVTNDSGPMHIGAAFGTPLVALFGSTDDKLTGPYGQPEAVIHKRPSCSPCFKRECPIDFRCMRGIEVEEVVDKVRRLLRV